MDFNYKAPKIVAAYMRDDSHMRVINGPQGSGKSSGSCIELLRRSISRRPDSDGIRRAKFAVVRNTVPMLRDTTIPTFLQWFPHGTLGHWHATDKTYYFKFGDVESQVLFRALDDKDDIGKLLSAEYTGCYFNEFREIDPAIYEAMTKRVGRWKTDPKWGKADIDEAWYGIWADTNPPQVGSWHHHMMEKIIPNDWKVFKQPSGRSPEAENMEHLRSDYYDTTGLSEEYIRVMIDGEYGYDQSGLPVFGKTFLPNWHVEKEPLRWSRNTQYPLLVGIDAGLKPAAVIGQRDFTGRLLILGECYVPPDQSMGMERFLDTMLLPYLQTHFPGAGRATVTADPAVNHRGQANEKTPYDILAKYFTVAIAFTDKLPARLGAAETWLSGQIDGRPKIVFDPRTPFLQAALAHNYRFAKKKNTGGIGDDTKDLPEKNHPSNTADAFMYLCMSVAGGYTGGGQPQARKIVVADSRGWT